MSKYSDLKAAEITTENTFRIMFSGYEYLRDLPENPGSGTYKLLKKIEAGDAETLINCYLKMREEQDEAAGVISGRHRDEKYTPGEQMINETEQSIYWPGLVAVGRRVAYDMIDLPRFIGIGFNGKQPLDVSKADWKDGVDGRPDEKAIIAFRRSLVTAGKLLYDFNHQASSGKKIEPKDLAVCDIKQMAEREYLQPFLVEQGILDAFQTQFSEE